ncbi:hypothetical protein Goshw_007688, partial [Gossypium schwendimanii]|nr:hypothetical protein [Gossypium schwendimanii]
MKVNVDDSVLTFESRAAIGGVLRGLNGSWMGVFDMVVGLLDIFKIEARALLEGLKFVWAKGYHKVEIKRLGSKISAILRENNGVANRTTKEARGEMDHLIIHEEPRGSVRGLLDDDIHCATISFD